MPELPSFEVMDAAFRERDASFDGLFFAAVTTTGIFCRPSCPARKPLPGNVAYYATAAEALFAGYRPCERCKPLASAADPEWLRRLVARVEAEPGRRVRDARSQGRGAGSGHGQAAFPGALRPELPGLSARPPPRRRLRGHQEGRQHRRGGIRARLRVALGLSRGFRAALRRSAGKGGQSARAEADIHPPRLDR